jgi:hypothetical protein
MIGFRGLGEFNNEVEYICTNCGRTEKFYCDDDGVLLGDYDNDNEWVISRSV